MSRPWIEPGPSQLRVRSVIASVNSLSICRTNSIKSYQFVLHNEISVLLFRNWNILVWLAGHKLSTHQIGFCSITKQIRLSSAFELSVNDTYVAGRFSSNPAAYWVIISIDRIIKYALSGTGLYSFVPSIIKRIVKTGSFSTIPTFWQILEMIHYGTVNQIKQSIKKINPSSRRTFYVIT